MNGIPLNENSIVVYHRLCFNSRVGLWLSGVVSSFHLTNSRLICISIINFWLITWKGTKQNNVHQSFEHQIKNLVDVNWVKQCKKCFLSFPTNCFHLPLTLHTPLIFIKMPQTCRILIPYELTDIHMHSRRSLTRSLCNISYSNSINKFPSTWHKHTVSGNKWANWQKEGTEADVKGSVQRFSFG